MGWASDQTWGFGNRPVFPNASRTAWATEETGFHSAKVRSPAGRRSLRTNVLATNVTGKMNMKEAFWTTSTLDTFNPTKAMIQEIAYANSSSRRKPPMALAGPVLMRQPTIRPASDMTSIEIEL